MELLSQEDGFAWFRSPDDDFHHRSRHYTFAFVKHSPLLYFSLVRMDRGIRHTRAPYLAHQNYNWVIYHASSLDFFSSKFTLGYLPLSLNH